MIDLRRHTLQSRHHYPSPLTHFVCLIITWVLLEGASITYNCYHWLTMAQFIVPAFTLCNWSAAGYCKAFAVVVWLYSTTFIFLRLILSFTNCTGATGLSYAVKGQSQWNPVLWYCNDSHGQIQLKACMSHLLRLESWLGSTLKHLQLDWSLAQTDLKHERLGAHFLPNISTGSLRGLHEVCLLPGFLWSWPQDTQTFSLH